ncbi:MAG: hypothetical protein AAFR61_28570 [Bacteroidota bacterium]
MKLAQNSLFQAKAIRMAVFFLLAAPLFVQQAQAQVTIDIISINLATPVDVSPTTIYVGGTFTLEKDEEVSISSLQILDENEQVVSSFTNPSGSIYDPGVGRGTYTLRVFTNEGTFDFEVTVE